MLHTHSRSGDIRPGSPSTQRMTPSFWQSVLSACYLAEYCACLVGILDVSRLASHPGCFGRQAAVYSFLKSFTKSDNTFNFCRVGLVLVVRFFFSEIESVNIYPSAHVSTVRLLRSFRQPVIL